MATSLDTISGIGANARKLAKLLQAKAPEGHMLAYINPREAALLKAHGGSGKPHADTGIPSFEEAPPPPDFGAEGTFDTLTPESSVESTFTTYDPAGFSYPGQPVTSGSRGTDLQLSSSPEPISTPTAPTASADIAAAQQQLTGLGDKTQEEKSLIEKAAKLTGMKEETLGRLGIATVMGLLGARTAKAAAKSGQAGAQQMQQLATPYQQKGQELQAQAQRGELTPQGMQSLQAAQAQAAQGVEKRGGVGVAQAQAQVEQLRQQLLSQQYDYGLKLSGIGDNIALGAIKTGMEADRYVQGINNSFYQNMAYIASGMTPGARG
jgi:hypothetical protein